MCESVEEIETLPLTSIIHKPGSRVNRNPIVPHLENLKAPALACMATVIALIVTPDGLPLAYKVMPGNTNDSTTLRGFLARPKGD